MKKIFLIIFDFFEKKRTFSFVLMILLTLGLFFLASRINYEEDISKFLPNNNNNELGKSLEQLTSQNNIAILFYGKDSVSQDRIIEAIEKFAEIVDEDIMIENLSVTVDQTQMFDLIEAVYEHIPYLLTESDYNRIDSLLKTPNFINNQLEEDKKILMLPSAGTFAKTITYDPLRLFSPALQKLQSLKINSSMQIIDDYIFTADGKYGIVTFDTPFGANESGNNTQLAKHIDKLLYEIESEFPDIKAVAIGAPLIAVANSTQIKKDSLLAVTIALVLIFLILFLHYRRITDIAWVGFTILFGVLFAIAGMSVLKSSTSIIVLGIGSVIIGIAANYPLHFLDEYKEIGDRRATLIEMIRPLLIGNITTIAAFVCLVWLDAQAMKDLGIFGSLVLFGTILFVLIFLPHLIKKRPSPSENKLFGKLSNFHLSRSKAKSFIALLIAILTLFFGYFSTKTSFDSNLSHINFMTEQQRESMKVLSEIQPSDALYAVAIGNDLKSAVEHNNNLIKNIRKVNPDIQISGIGEFLPDEKSMLEAANRWNNFWKEKSHNDIIKQFEICANREGFSVTAFYPFTSMLTNEYGISEIEDFNDFIQPFLNKYIFLDDEGCKIINYVYTDDKTKLHKSIDTYLTDNCYLFSNEELGDKLIEMLRESFDFIGLVCGIVVFVFLLISFRKVEIALLAFLPLTLAWIWILGIMHLLNIQFNIVNIILATFIFGQGDDYTIFITEGLLYEYTTGKPRLAAYKHSVFISAIIMFAGIGCLIIAKHPALHSLATVTIIGMLTVVLMAVFVPPLLFDFLIKKNGKKRRTPLTLKRIFYSFIYGSAFVVMVFLLVQPFTFFYFLIGKDSDEKREKFHKVIQKISLLYSKHIPGVKHTLRNNHNEKFDKPAVIICNHQSHLDILYILSLTPKIIFLTNDWVWRNPLYGLVIRKAEFYPVSNGFEDNFPKLQDLYERGYSICIFPEGTRSTDCKIMRFHKGAFALARKLNADILPLYLHGAGHILPKEELILCEGETLLEIGERYKPYLENSSDNDNSIDLCTAKKMRHHYLEHYSKLCDEIETDEYNEKILYYQNYYTTKI